MSSIVNTRNLECPICLETFDKPTVTSCGHSYCLECITPFLNKPCPSCREPVTTITQNISLLSVVTDAQEVPSTASTASKVMTSASPALGTTLSASSSASSASPVDAALVMKLNVLNQELSPIDLRHFAYLCGLSQGQYDESYAARERVIKKSLEAIGNNFGIVRSILDLLGLLALSEKIGGGKTAIAKQDRVIRYRTFVELDQACLKSLQSLLPVTSHTSSVTLYEFNQMIDNSGVRKVADMLRLPSLGKNYAAGILDPAPPAPSYSPAPVVYPRPTPEAFRQLNQISSYPTSSYPTSSYSTSSYSTSSYSTSRYPTSSSSSSSAAYSPPAPSRQWPSEIKQCLDIKASTIATARSKLLALLMTLPDSNIKLQQKLLLVALHIDDKTCETIKTRFDILVSLKDNIKSSLDLVMTMYGKLGTEKEVYKRIETFLSEMSDEGSEKEPCFTFRDLACESRRAIVNEINKCGVASKPTPGDLLTLFFMWMKPQLRYCLAVHCGFVGNRLDGAKEDANKLLESLRNGAVIDFNRDYRDLVETLMQIPLGE